MDKLIIKEVSQQITIKQVGGQGPKGNTGEAGQDGSDGLSAYEVWLADGNTGTVDDYLLSLKGPKGDKGDKGDPGSGGGGDGLPTGGSTGQVLTKISSADGDADWQTPSGGGGGGVNEGAGSGGVDSSTAYGKHVLEVNTTGSANTGVGFNALKDNIDGNNNVVIGNDAMPKAQHASRIVSIGYKSLYNFNSYARAQIAIGQECLYNLQSGEANLGVGYLAGYRFQNGSYNMFLGNEVASYLTDGSENIFIGANSVYNMTLGQRNISIGVNNFHCQAGYNITLNTAIGQYSLNNNAGDGNVAVGPYTFTNKGNGNNNTALGMFAGYTGSDWTNVTCLGYFSQVTGNNQVQLGDSDTSVYCFGSVQNRSDSRDKADIEPTVLGSDFLNRLKPVQYRYDYRDDYEEPVHTENEDKTITTEIIHHPKDGSKKRSRLHQGLLADDVKRVCDEMGVDFGGYQDHSINGGKDVKSLGYIEFIGPLIKGFQEQQTQINTMQSQIDELMFSINKLTEKVNELTK